MHQVCALTIICQNATTKQTIFFVGTYVEDICSHEKTPAGKKQALTYMCAETPLKEEGCLPVENWLLSKKSHFLSNTFQG